MARAPGSRDVERPRGAARTSAAAARQLRAWSRDQPAAWLDLPWPEPQAARASLGFDERARLASFEDALRGAWCGRSPHERAAELFSWLEPASRVALYQPCGPGGGAGWFVQNLTTSGLVTRPFRHHDILPEVRLYEPDGHDPFGDRPVVLPALALRATRRENTLPLYERLLVPNDAHQQLRMVIYRRGQAALYAGWFRTRTERHFSLADHGLLLAARPALRAWFAVASAIGVTPMGDGALVSALDAMVTPALLLYRRQVAYANAAAVGLVPRVVAWDRAGRPGGFAITAPIGAGGLVVELVLPQAPRGPARIEGSELDRLPAALRRVAALVADGLSDKEIAIALDMPLSTARTYVGRLLRRLGVSDRRRLMRARG